MKEKAITKQKSTASTSVHEIQDVSSELYKVGMYITSAFAAVIGVWSIICLSSALMNTGGPIALVKSMFNAIL